MPDRGHLTSGRARRGVPDGDGEMCGRQHRVVPLGDRRRAGVVGDARDDRFVPVDRDDAFHDAHGNARALERAALLDVQLEIAVKRPLRAARLEDTIGIAADLADRVAAAHAVPHLVHVARRDITGDDPAAGEAAAECEAFLVRPDDHLERMARADAGRRERLERGER